MSDTLTDDQVWTTEPPEQSSTSEKNQPLSDEEVWTPPAQQIAQKQNAVHSIASAFGQGFNEATGGYQDLGISEDNQKLLHDSGIYKNTGLLGQAIYDQVITPAASALDTVARTLTGSLVSGPVMGMAQAVHESGLDNILSGVRVSDETAHGNTEAMNEMVLNSPLLGGFNFPKLFNVPKFSRGVPPVVRVGQAHGVVGVDEAQFMGTKPFTENQSLTQHVATESLPQEEPQPDIHTLARQAAPATFNTYDRLSTQADTLRDQLSDLKSNQTADLDTQIKEIQDAKKGGYGKLQSLIAKRDELTSQETPEMADIRQKIQENDYQMRDLAPQVSQAYRDAENQLPKSSEQPKEAPPETAPEAAKQSFDIAADVSKNLVAAGRPIEEANAASQLVAEHYKAVSEQGWTKGTPEEIYNRDMANIRGVRERVLTQKDQSPALDNSSEVSGRDLDNTRATSSPGTQEPLRQTSDSSLPSGVFTTRAIQPSESAGGVGNISGSDLGITKLYHTTADIEKLKSLASGAEADLHNLLKKISEDVGGAKFSGVRLKDEKELNIKLQRKPPQEISDYLGGRIIVDSPDVAREVLGKLQQTGNVTHIDDFMNESRSDGYRAIHAQIMGNDGLSAEVQIQPKEISNVLKDGHILYKEQQKAARDGDADRVLQLQEQLKETYDNAWDKWSERNAELAQGARGKIRLATDDAKAVITLMKSANASTFIHEIGHHWLDEMMRYAEAKDAPERLLKDSKTVRDWLGVKSGDIPTRAHEKFARGFERYLMEGVAPSRELAGVFAKFKAWLTQIYKTVQRLRSPISDDIRDVFDRLISSKPEKTVIASEPEAGKSLADIHEEDARNTPPERAAPVADNIRNEVKTTAKKDTEASDAIGAGEQTGTGAGDLREPERTEPNAPQTEPQAVNDGGNGSAQVGNSPRAKSTGSARPPRNTERGAERNDPNAVLGKPESNLVDKAGNIRLDNLNTPEDVNDVLRQAASENQDFLEARRGIIPVGEQLNLADALGMRPHDLDFRKIGQAFNAEQIIAARKLLIQSAKNVRDLMNGDDVQAYAEARTRHVMIQEQVAGITAEAGRALGAFRKLEGGDEAKSLGDFLKQATGKDLFQLEQEMKLGRTLETSAQVSKFINDTKKSTARDMILEYYINCLISGPITHLRYSVGNAINALATPLIEIPFQSAIGKTREILTGNAEDRVYLGEAKAQLQGLFKGSQDGLKAAIMAFKTGQSPLLPTEHMGMDFSDVKVNAIPGKIGQVINIPSRGVSAIHSFFKSIRYEQGIQALAYRNAMKEGLEGEDFTDRVAELSVNPSEEMMQSATQNSLKELYMAPTEYNSTMGALNRAINSNLAAKIIVPFMKIGSQITRNAFIEHTPLGLLDKDVRGNLIGKNGGAAFDTQLGKVAFGTTLIGGTSLMVMQGLATGDGPSDPAQRAIWMLNHSPNSLQIGDITIKYQGLGHLGMLMRFSANMTETAQGWDHEDGAKLATAFIEGITKSVLDENFMRGIKDMLDAVYHPEEYGPSYVKSFVTNWLPYSVGMSQVARKIDPYQRDISSKESLPEQIFDTARSKIPLVSEGLQPRRDRFGEPIPNGAPLPKYENDPVVQRLESLQIGIGRLDRKIRNVPLTDQQYDDYSRLAGRMTKMRLDAVVGTISNAPQSVQVDTIKSIISTSRETARSIIMMQNPEIIRQAVSQKMKAASGK